MNEKDVRVRGKKASDWGRGGKEKDANMEITLEYVGKRSEEGKEGEETGGERAVNGGISRYIPAKCCSVRLPK